MQTFRIYLNPGQGFLRLEADEVKEGEGVLNFYAQGQEVGHFLSYTGWMLESSVK